MSFKENLEQRVTQVTAEIERFKQNILMLQGHLAEAQFQLSEYEKSEVPVDTAASDCLVDDAQN